MVFASVIIPTYNRASLLQRCLSSILSQDFSNFEVIVVDDGSTDNTKEILKSYKNIKTIYQENQGVSAARNRGIEIANGDYIAFCDSDDEWKKDKLYKQVDLLANNDFKVCYTDEIWIRKGKRVNQCKRHSKVSGNIFEKSLELCIVSPSSVMMEKSFFDKVGLFDESMPACEDYDLWLRTAIDIPIYLVDTPCIIKNGGHSDQLSSDHSLDKYRLQSLESLIKNYSLPPSQRESAIKVFKEKCFIYGNGCIKRGKTEEGNYFLNLADCF